MKKNKTGLENRDGARDANILSVVARDDFSEEIILRLADKMQKEQLNLNFR